MTQFKPWWLYFSFQCNFRNISIKLNIYHAQIKLCKLLIKPTWSLIQVLRCLNQGNIRLKPKIYISKVRVWINNFSTQFYTYPNVDTTKMSIYFFFKCNLSFTTTLHSTMSLHDCCVIVLSLIPFSVALKGSGHHWYCHSDSLP